MAKQTLAVKIPLVKKVFLILGLALSMMNGHSAEQDVGPSRSTLNYMLVVTGGELLSGAVADAHTHFITRTLSPLGLNCVASIIVDDRQADIIEALSMATNKAPLVIVTGGLGPTDNDITRQTLSKFTGIALREHPEVIREMERRFGQNREQLRPNLRRQAQIPERGTYLKNPNGSAVGLIFDLGKITIVALPGPPRELQPMVTNELVPFLHEKFGTRHTASTLTLRFVGIGQSLIDHTLKQKMSFPPDVIQSSVFDGMRVDFIFSLPDHSEKGLERLQQLKKQILEHLGEYYYGDGETTLEEHVIEEFKRRDLTLAIAEVGSGGLIAASLSSASNANTVLTGAWTGSSEQWIWRSLRQRTDALALPSSESTIKALAQAVCKCAESKCALVVGAVERNGNIPNSVEVGFLDSTSRWSSQKMQLGKGESGRRALVTQALDFLRRQLKTAR